jgi:phosphoglycerate-specific signal transduction histidine kinase
MIKDGNRAGEIINRIRAMVKKAPPQRESLNINDTIMEVMALVLAEVRRNGVSAQAELSPDLPLVLGDRIQLQQVVLNLIVNALEAMSGIDQMQRRLSISSIRDEPNGVLVAVSDSGSGLDPRHWTASLMPFTPPKLMAWEWGLQSARRLFKPTAGGCGLRLTYPRGLYSSLDCRLTALWPAANEFPWFVSEPWTNHESIVHRASPTTSWRVRKRSDG